MSRVRFLLPLAIGAVLGPPAVLAATATAQDTTVVLGGPAARSLSAGRIAVQAGRPARMAHGRLTLPTAAVTISGRRAQVEHAGTVRLRAGGRSVVLSQLRVTVGSRSTLSARVGDGARRTLATIAAGPNRRAVDAAGTYVTQSPLVLTAATVRLLRAQLRRPGLRGGRLGTIDLQAAAPASAAPGGDLPGAPAAPTVTGPPTPGGATVAARPAGAVSITGGSVAWSPRSSWLGYLQSGEGARGEQGARFDGTTFTLAIRDGWFDAASGTAVVSTTGTTRFGYRAHGLDIAFADWAYDLAGPAPKAVATVTAASGVAPAVIGTRRPIGLIKPAALSPVVGADGHTVTWSSVPLTLSAEGVPIYRAYLFDSDQGSLTITATVG